MGKKDNQSNIKCVNIKEGKVLFYVRKFNDM